MTARPNTFPKARTADLITERVGGELVVYDGQTSEAHCLSAIAATVFTAADGTKSPADLAVHASAELNERVDVDHVERALAELEDRGLVIAPEAGGLSRRGFMQRGAAVGGVVVAGSLVTSVVTPAYGSTGSLPSGPPASFSSLAVQITCGTTVYGAHWTSSHTGAPDQWGATEANANCPVPGPWTDTTSSAPPGVNPVTLAFVSGGMCISIPSTCTVTDYAAFFGKGAPGQCGSQQCFTFANNGGASFNGSCYLVTFPASCYGP